MNNSNECTIGLAMSLENKVPNHQPIDQPIDRVSSSHLMNVESLSLVRHTAKVAVIELGAGVAVPTVRYTMEAESRKLNAPLIRINPEYPDVPSSVKRSVSITLGAVDALQAIDAEIERIKASRSL